MDSIARLGQMSANRVKRAGILGGLGKGLDKIVGGGAGLAFKGLGSGKIIPTALTAGGLAAGAGAVNEGLSRVGGPSMDFADGAAWSPDEQAFRNATNMGVGDRVANFFKRPIQSILNGSDALPENLSKFTRNQLPDGVKMKHVGWNPDGTMKYEYSGTGSPSLPPAVRAYLQQAQQADQTRSQWGLKLPGSATSPEAPATRNRFYEAAGPSLTSTF